MDTSFQSTEINDLFFERRQIILQGEVNRALQLKATQLILTLSALSTDPITVFIDTFGGSTEPALSICDAIEMSQAKVKGLVLAQAQSSGFMILQACHWRLAYPNAHLLFHGPAIENVPIDSARYEEMIKTWRDKHEEWIQTYAKRNGQPVEQWRAWSKEEKKFSAQEALKLGLLDEVLEPPQRPIVQAKTPQK